MSTPPWIWQAPRLTALQRLMLIALHEALGDQRGPVRVAALAEQLGASLGATSEALTALVGRGLVGRAGGGRAGLTLWLCVPSAEAAPPPIPTQDSASPPIVAPEAAQRPQRPSRIRPGPVPSEIEPHIAYAGWVELVNLGATLDPPRGPAEVVADVLAAVDLGARSAGGFVNKCYRDGAPVPRRKEIKSHEQPTQQQQREQRPSRAAAARAKAAAAAGAALRVGE